MGQGVTMYVVTFELFALISLSCVFGEEANAN